MPRQLPRKSRVSHDVTSAMSQRPTLAVLVARIATNWSRTEERIGSIIIQLLGAEAHTGMKMYRALSGSASQKAVLRAVANDRLDKPMLDRLETILALFKTVAGKRNKVVHGHWLVSDNHPEELVWEDSSEALLRSGQFWGGYNAQKDFAGQMEFARGYDTKPNYILYSANDFEDILREISLLTTKLGIFATDCEKLHRPPRDVASVGKV